MSARVLVGCPNQVSKEYAFSEWVDAVHAFTYPDLEILVVDNSHGLNFYNRWKSKVPMVRMDPGEPGQMHANRRIALSMEVLRQKFIAEGFDFWLNLESDVVAPPNTVELLLEYVGSVDMFCAPYPVRDRQQDMNTNSFGCTLFSRLLMSEMSFKDAPENPTTDRWIHNEVIAPAKGRYQVANLSPGILPLKHLQNTDPSCIGWDWW